MSRSTVSLALAVASLAMFTDAFGQVSSPYFEISGGIAEAEMVVPSGNFVPAGALERDSAVLSGVPTAATVFLRDPGFDGTPRRVCVDYIGTDAGFQNRFFVPGTTINWCNKASCQDPTSTPLGTGNLNWTGPFAASACFQMNVGQPVPFVYVADVLNQGGDGTHTVGNGQANPGANWAVFPYPFIFALPFPGRSPVIGVGLSDGAYSPALDDDHQDFTVRFSVQPGASDVPTLNQWGLVLLVLGLSIIGAFKLTVSS